MKSHSTFTTIIIGLMLCLLTHAAVAVQFTCPRTFRMVTSGMTMDQVTQFCGKPTSVQSLDQQQTGQQTTMYQWIYAPPLGPNQSEQYQPQLVITFQNDKVSQMATNNMSGSNLANSIFFRCYQMSQIHIGDDKSNVEKFCGTPRYVNSLTGSAQQQQRVEQWTYNFGQYRPLMLFIFKDGVLDDIRVSSLPVTQ